MTNPSLVLSYGLDAFSGVSMYFEDKEILGEITVVIKGKQKEQNTEFNKADLKNDLNALIEAGLSLSAASKFLAKKHGIKKSIIYNLN